MSRLDTQTLAEKAAAVQRHLLRVAQNVPAAHERLTPDTSQTDTVLFHLWLATQLVLDIASALVVRLGFSSPPTYASTFAILQEHGVIDAALADRLRRAAGFRNLVAHADEAIDLEIAHRAALEGPADLMAFLVAAARALPK